MGALTWLNTTYSRLTFQRRDTRGLYSLAKVVDLPSSEEVWAMGFSHNGLLAVGGTSGGPNASLLLFTMIGTVGASVRIYGADFQPVHCPEVKSLIGPVTYLKWQRMGVDEAMLVFGTLYGEVVLWLYSRNNNEVQAWN
jgi:hypothetical protein